MAGVKCEGEGLEDEDGPAGPDGKRLRSSVYKSALYPSGR